MKENMDFTIRAMAAQDKGGVLEMMRVFYTSPAVFTDGSEEIYLKDVEACIGDNPFLEGYVFEAEGELRGYAMVAKSFSTEFGKPCMWIEDLYLKEGSRGAGMGKAFFDFLAQKYTDCIFRLEVEEENERAIRLYQKSGFTVLPYMEMKK